MRNLAVIQARTGSTRLPGKVMYPLNGKPVLYHVINRTMLAEELDDVIVATSKTSPDDVIATYASIFGVDVFRGDESNVLRRYKKAIDRYRPGVIVRITGDCPLIMPKFIDYSLRLIQEQNLDYTSAGMEKTFPNGLTCEAFTRSSFADVVAKSTQSHHKEHVTPYYYLNKNEFNIHNITSDEIFEMDYLQNRTDIRLTLDEPKDYQLIEKVYREVNYENILPVEEAIKYIDLENLQSINHDVEQKKVGETE